ncbi:MAG: hypothetical protein AAFS10_12965 [Myxococcota bacterium]
MKNQVDDSRFRGWMAARLVMAACVVAGLVWPQVAAAQEPTLTRAEVSLRPDQREILVKERRFRFVLPRSWQMREGQGIYIISSADKQVLMVMVLLDKPEEVTEALRELDKMVVVTGSSFSEPWNALQGTIPVQFRAGAGTMQPSGRPVELLMAVMNILNRPVLTMFYVHKEAYAAQEPTVKEILKSFALLLSPQELEALRKSLPELADEAKKTKTKAP